MNKQEIERRIADQRQVINDQIKVLEALVELKILQEQVDTSNPPVRLVR